jgi:hypothetical protein
LFDEDDEAWHRWRVLQEGERNRNPEVRTRLDRLSLVPGLWSDDVIVAEESRIESAVRSSIRGARRPAWCEEHRTAMKKVTNEGNGKEAKRE